MVFAHTNTHQHMSFAHEHLFTHIWICEDVTEIRCACLCENVCAYVFEYAHVYYSTCTRVFVRVCIRVYSQQHHTTLHYTTRTHTYTHTHMHYTYECGHTKTFQTYFAHPRTHTIALRTCMRLWHVLYMCAWSTCEWVCEVHAYLAIIPTIDQVRFRDGIYLK